MKGAGKKQRSRAAGKRTLEIEKSSKELLTRLRQFRGRVPKDFKFDRLEANDAAVDTRSAQFAVSDRRLSVK